MLDAIYSGEYQGIDIARPDSAEYCEALAKFHAIYGMLREKMEKEEQELLDELLSNKNILLAEESREYYQHGFSAGAILMIDIFQQYQRSIK